MVRNLIENLDKSIPTFDTVSPLWILWELFVLVFTSVQLYFYSLQKCFVVDLQLHVLEHLLSIFLFIELFVKLNTRLYIDGHQITERAKIIRSFMKTNLLSDILPCAALCLTFITSNEGIRDINLVLLFKIVNAMDLGAKIREIIIKGDKSESLYELLLLAIKILIWAHLMACFWHYIAYLSFLENPDSNSWLISKGLIKEKWSVRYLFSIYWGVTTMLTVGYGDITPVNQSEMIFNIWAMVLGCGIFGYSMTRIGEIIKFSDKQDRKLRKEKKKVLKLLKDKRLPHDTEIKVKKYLEFVWKQEQKCDPEYEKSIMSKLSSKLRDEVAYHMNVKYLKRVPAFKYFSDKSLIAIGNFMKKVRYCPEEIVVNQGEEGDASVFFVIDGNLELIWQQEGSHSYVKFVPDKLIKKDDCFGIEETFTGFPPKYGVRSSDFSTLFKLSRIDLLHILKKTPEDYEKFCKLRDLDVIYNNTMNYNIKCDSCGYADHNFTECQFLKYVPTRLQIISRYVKLKRGKQKARKFSRRRKKSKNALSNRNLYFDSLEDFQVDYEEDDAFNDWSQFYDKLDNEDCQSIENHEYERKNSEDNKTFDRSISEEEKDYTEFEEQIPVSLKHIEKQKSTSSQHAKSRGSIKTLSSQEPRLQGGILKNHATDKENHNKQKGRNVKIHPDSYKNKASSHSIDEDFFYHDMDRVKSYSFFFPWNNVENISKKVNSILLNKRWGHSHI